MLWLLLCSYEYVSLASQGGVADEGGNLDTEPMDRRGQCQHRSYGVA